MSEFISSISDYLNNKPLVAKDVITISVISSFVFWATKGIVIYIGNMIYKGITKLIVSIFKPIKKYYRLLIKHSMNVNEYIEAKNRLDSGGKLKWYERKAFYILRKVERENARTIKEQMKEFEKTTNRLKNDLFQ